MNIGASEYKSPAVLEGDCIPDISGFIVISDASIVGYEPTILSVIFYKFCLFDIKTKLGVTTEVIIMLLYLKFYYISSLFH